MPNVLRRFLAMTARVPITHVADTAQSPHQARQLSLPANKHHRPGRALGNWKRCLCRGAQTLHPDQAI